MNFRVLPDAESEAASAMAWYDDQRPGLGDEFIEAVYAAYEQVHSNLNLIPRLERYQGPNVLRRYLLRRFLIT